MLFVRRIPHAKTQRRKDAKTISCRLFITQVPKMSPDPPDNCDCDRDSNNEVEAMKPGLEQRVLVPLLTQLLPDVRQAKTPRQRSGKSVDDELFQIHPRHSCGKRDEGANCRQQTANENDGLAITRKPAIGKIEVVM